MHDFKFPKLGKTSKQRERERACGVCVAAVQSDVRWQSQLVEVHAQDAHCKRSDDLTTC